MLVLVSTLIEIEGPMPEDGDEEGAAAFFSRALKPGAILGCSYKVLKEDDFPKPNVSGGTSLQ